MWGGAADVTGGHGGGGGSLARDPLGYLRRAVGSCKGVSTPRAPASVCWLASTALDQSPTAGALLAPPAPDGVGYGTGGRGRGWHGRGDSDGFAGVGCAGAEPLIEEPGEALSEAVTAVRAVRGAIVRRAKGHITAVAFGRLCGTVDCGAATGAMDDARLRAAAVEAAAAEEAERPASRGAAGEGATDGGAAAESCTSIGGSHGGGGSGSGSSSDSALAHARLRSLLDAGLKNCVDCADEYGRTPLFIAASGGTSNLLGFRFLF